MTKKIILDVDEYEQLKSDAARAPAKKKKTPPWWTVATPAKGPCKKIYGNGSGYRDKYGDIYDSDGQD